MWWYFYFLFFVSEQLVPRGDGRWSVISGRKGICLVVSWTIWSLQRNSLCESMPSFLAVWAASCSAILQKLPPLERQRIKVRLKKLRLWQTKLPATECLANNDAVHMHTHMQGRQVLGDLLVPNQKNKVLTYLHVSLLALCLKQKYLKNV